MTITSRIKTAWPRRLGLLSLVLCSSAHGQELGVRWTDPKMDVLAGTYDVQYQSDWTHGLGAGVDVQRAQPGDIAVTTDPVNPEHRAVSIQVRKQEDFSHVANGSPRAELVFSKAFKIARGADYLIRWSTYIPPTFQFDTGQMIVITQIHQGALSGPPPVELTLQGTRYVFTERGGNHAGRDTSLCCASNDQGKWINWVLRYVPDPTGVHASTQLWKDGVSVYGSRGEANAYPDDDSAYLKMGLYLPYGWGTAASSPAQFALGFGPVLVGRR
jgi:hypothetical protein